MYLLELLYLSPLYNAHEKRGVRTFQSMTYCHFTSSNIWLEELMSVFFCHDKISALFVLTTGFPPIILPFINFLCVFPADISVVIIQELLIETGVVTTCVHCVHTASFRNYLVLYLCHPIPTVVFHKCCRWFVPFPGVRRDGRRKGCGCGWREQSKDDQSQGQKDQGRTRRCAYLSTSSVAQIRIFVFA